MPQFHTFIDVESGRLPKPAGALPEPLKCPSCKSSFFEEVECKQYVDDHSVILGQPPPVQGGAQFYLLRCVKCSELLEPRLVRQARDMVNKQYDKFVDELTAGNEKPVAQSPLVEKI